MRRLATWHEQAKMDGPGKQLARYQMAEFLSANSERVYWNDRIWGGLQRYAMTAETEVRATPSEREILIRNQRKLKDEQEERWQAYLILRTIIRETDDKELKRRATRLAIQCTRHLYNDRFGRQDELQAADIELSKWLRNQN